MTHGAFRWLGGAGLAALVVLWMPGCGGDEAPPPCTPQAEVCDGLDNDCDGVVDDGDPGGGAACATGLLGVCAAGTQHCVGGAVQCVQNVQASAEVCDGLDNDCDGTVDDGNPGAGGACNTGLLGVCAAGTYSSCSGGALTCVQSVQASAEVCDGLDNDCDGAVDDGDPGGGAACTTGLQGVCAAGTQHCAGGAVQCVQDVQASTEICDGLDNDCDGTVDEGCGACTNALLDPGFEAGPGGTSWTQFSTNFGTPLCDEFSCGVGAAPPGPHGGLWWAWFGGVPATEVGYVRQSAVIPVGSNNLSFWLKVPACAAVPSDKLLVRIDGTPIYTVTAADPRCGVNAYAQVSLDITAWANGASHQVEFYSETFDTGQSPVTNFFVDDVAICP